MLDTKTVFNKKTVINGRIIKIIINPTTSRIRLFMIVFYIKYKNK